MTKKQQEEVKQNSLKPENMLALLHSVIKYVHDKGFLKTFKRFLREAKVEDDAWKAAFDLEEMYSKYLKNCRNGETNFKGHKKQERSAPGTMEKDAGGDKAAPIETISKKKKKKLNEEDGDNAKSAICELKSDECMKELIDKKKKTSKLTSESFDKNGRQEDLLPGITERKQENLEIMGGICNEDSVETTKLKDKLKKQKLSKGAENAVTRDTDAADVELDDSNMKSKEKKRKQKDSVSEKLSDNGTENKGKSQETSENGYNKVSKKRKRSAFDEIKDKPAEGVAIEESKRRKAEGLEEAEVAVQHGEVNTVLGADGHVGGETKEENGNASERKPQKSYIKQFDGSTKGDTKNNGVDKSAERTAKNSAEPKTVNAFQRVKADAVEFADDRLQDNSYWAKDGAENGYGAKAQQVLGQVKGRGFRHEKTKKKRGSYRGGQIDLQSHSVKFDYSDEE